MKKFRKKRNNLMKKLYWKGRFNIVKRYFEKRMVHCIEGGILYGDKFDENNYDHVSLTEYLSNPKIDIYKRSA